MKRTVASELRGAAGIRAYNEEDCRSAYELHRWLLGLRPRELRGDPAPGPQGAE